MKKNVVYMQSRMGCCIYYYKLTITNIYVDFARRKTLGGIKFFIRPPP